MWRSAEVTVRVMPSALLTPAAFLLLTPAPALLLALLLAALCHELAHYAVLRLYGIRAAQFTLTGLGASLYVPELHRLSYGAELLSAAAGPLMNLLPVRPMDGGRILWLSTAYLTEPYTADRVSAAVGLAASSALFLLCLYLMASTGSGLFLLLGALWLTYRSLPPQIFLPRRLAKPAKNR